MKKYIDEVALQYTKEYMATDNIKQNKHLPHKELVKQSPRQSVDVENEVRTEDTLRISNSGP